MTEMRRPSPMRSGFPLQPIGRHALTGRPAAGDYFVPRSCPSRALAMYDLTAKYLLRGLVGLVHSCLLCCWCCHRQRRRPVRPAVDHGGVSIVLAAMCRRGRKWFAGSASPSCSRVSYLAFFSALAGGALLFPPSSSRWWSAWVPDTEDFANA